MEHIENFANLDMECACGRRHRVPIRWIFSGENALHRLGEALEPFRGKKVFLMGDAHTMPLAEDATRAKLAAAGCSASSHTFESDVPLSLNETLIGEALILVPRDTDLLLTIGSGTLNDLSRVIAAYMRIPYAIVCTAPSMDGYASAVSAIITKTGKHSFPLDTTPYAIIADPALLRTAPDVMLSSGVCDILGKFFALTDWKLSERETGEFFCPYIAGLVNAALDRCVASMDGVLRRDAATLVDTANTLIMSGAAIAMLGVSRPASGSEHQLSHHWEAELHKQKGITPLHGNLVGLGTEAVACLYALAAEEFDLDFPPYRVPTQREIAGYIQRLGGWATKETLGVSRELFYDSFFHATSSNNRYTLIMHLEKTNRLAHYAGLVTEAFYG